MFESIYNTEALLLAVKLNQRFHREREKFPSASPPPPQRSLAPWGQGSLWGHAGARGRLRQETLWAWQEKDSSEHPNQTAPQSRRSGCRTMTAQAERPQE